MVLSLRRKIHIDSLARLPQHKITKKFAESDKYARTNCLSSIQSINKNRRRVYKISERLKDLAKPVLRRNDMYVNSNPYSINKDVLKYKASPRILELAIPRDRDLWEYDQPKVMEKQTSCYQPTPRILELSQPKVNYRYRNFW